MHAVGTVRRPVLPVPTHRYRQRRELTTVAASALGSPGRFPAKSSCNEHKVKAEVKAAPVSNLCPISVETQSTTPSGSVKHAVVVGGGWGGFGAAYALLKAGVKVTILDASEKPGGLSAGWRTPGGRSVEAGIKGYGRLLRT